MGALIEDDLLFPAEAGARPIARDLYAAVKDLPIVSPHGHTDPRWYALDEPFPDPAQLLIVPDHYIFRMLFSQGVRLEELGVPRLDGVAGRDRRPEDLAALRRELSSLSRHADAALARLCAVAKLFGIDEPLTASDGRRALRHDRRAARRRTTTARARCSSASTSR